MSGGIDLDLSKVGLKLDGGVNVGLGDIAKVLDSGVHATADIGLGAVANVLGTGVNANVDAGLDDIRIREIGPIRADVGITELPVIRTDSKAEVDLGLDDIRIRELAPVRFELSLKPLRVHLPLNYSFSIELFGVRVFKFSLCGEGMVITEDYHPRATERC